MLFWWSIRETVAVHEVVRGKWGLELQARRAVGEPEAAMRCRRRSETFGRLMQRLERRLASRGVVL